MKYEWTADKNFLRGETTVQANDAAAATPGGMQIVGKDPLTGQIVTWFFHADGGHGYGVWTKDGSRWLLLTKGATPDGVLTTATNVLYHADENVISWQSVNRTAGGQVAAQYQGNRHRARAGKQTGGQIASNGPPHNKLLSPRSTR